MDESLVTFVPDPKSRLNEERRVRYFYKKGARFDVPNGTLITKRLSSMEVTERCMDEWGYIWTTVIRHTDTIRPEPTLWERFKARYFGSKLPTARLLP